MTRKSLCTAIGAALMLSACGGSSSSGKSGDDPKNNLTGTAAVGAPIQGSIAAVCADGDGFSSTVTSDANGNWGVEIDTARLPCALQVSYGAPSQTLHGYAATEGTANITPLTDLIIAYSSSLMPEAWFASTDITLSLGTDDVLDAFEDAGFTLPGGDFDPFTSAFDATAGDAYDDLLEALQQAIDEDAGIDGYAALLATVKDGTLSLPDAPEAPGGGGDIEAPEEGLSLLTEYAGTYTVECTAVTPGGSRLPATRDHHRGTIIIGEDGSIDVDTDIAFAATDINSLFDRTDIYGPSRRIHINYDEDDNGRRIDIYLTDTLEVTEIRYQAGPNSGDGRIRAAIGSDEHCDQGPQDDPELGDANGVSARMDGVRKTYTGHVTAATLAVPTPQGFNFNGKASSVATAAGWNIQGKLQAGAFSCEENHVSVSLFVGGTTNPVYADSCTVSATIFPAPEDGYQPEIHLEGTFTGTFTVDGETVTVTEGIFQHGGVDG